MTWEEEAAAIIRQVHASLPADADIQTRRKACIAAKPHHFASTSWGQKTWAKAQRKYLVQFGYVPKNAQSIPLIENHLSPLQRAMERAKRGAS